MSSAVGGGATSLVCHSGKTVRSRALPPEGTCHLPVVVGIVAVIEAVAVYKLLDTDTATSAQQIPTSTSAPSSTQVLPAPTPAPGEDPTGVRAAEDAARQGLTVAYTWYPSTDASSGDAYERARSWFTDSLARSIVDEVPERGPGIQWEEWARAGTTVIADVALGCSGCPPDTDNLIHRVATIDQMAITDDKSEKVTPATTVWVTIVRNGDKWLIDTIRY